VFGILVIEQHENIKFDFVLPAEINNADNFVESAFARVVDAVKIVQVGGAVDAYADEEIIVVQELTPFFIEQYRVGLDGIADLLVRQGVFFLQFNHLFIKIDAH